LPPPPTKPSRRQRRVAADSQTQSAVHHDPWSPYIFSLPVILLIAAILGFPVLYGVWQSLFRMESFGDPQEFVGIANYADMFNDPEFWHSFKVSVIFVNGCLIVGTVLGLVFGFALNRALGPVRWLRATSIAPYIVSSVAAAVMFRILFNRDFGLLNRIIEFFGFEGLPWLSDPKLAMVTVILCQVWTDLPLTILLVLGGLQMIDSSYLDSALVDGATGWRRAWHISMPLIAPQIAIAIIWQSYSTLTGIGVVLSLTGGGPLKATETLPMQMYDTAFTSLKMNEALAIGTFILVLNAVLTLMFFLISRRFGQEG